MAPIRYLGPMPHATRATPDRGMGMQQGAGEPGRFWGLTDQVIGACVEIHRALGPGLLESAYEKCLAHELTLRKVTFERQRPVPVTYKSVTLEYGYRLDFLVECVLVLEVKAVEQLLPVHEAQLLTYLKLTGFPIGLLINFNAESVTRGLRRMTLK